MTKFTKIIVPGAILLTVICYFAGLFGYFVLDDFPNLGQLAQLKDSPSLEQLAVYFGSVSGRGQGRFLSLISFALQYKSWSAHPFDFKVVNLAIHLINGVLVYFLVRKLFYLGRIADKKHAEIIAAVCSAVWLLHPIQISTVLYVVQRMTELMSLFTLLGMFLYLLGRERLIEGDSRYGYTYMTTGIVVCGMLAVLSKENGVILPLYCLIAEFTFLKDCQRDKAWKVWAAIFLIAPILILLTYFGLSAHRYFVSGYAERTFNVYERWLTQFRVLFDYLSMILLPVPGKFAFFYDDYTSSKGILTPWTTLPSMLGICGAFLWALIKRKKYPVVAFAILFYLCGHILESTVFPLELKFEHRNYLPLLGIVIGTMYLLFHLLEIFQNNKLKNITIILASIFFLNMVFVTWITAQSWGRPLLQAHLWAKQNPDSRRAQENLGLISLAYNDNKTTISVYKKGLETHRDDIYYLSQLLRLDCIIEGGVKPSDAQMLHTVFRTSPYQVTVINSIKYTIDLFGEGKCSYVDSEMLYSILQDLMNNPNYSKALHNLFYMRASLDVKVGNIPAMIKSIDLSLSKKAAPLVAMKAASWLLNAKKYDLAAKYIDKAEKYSKGSVSNMFYAYSLPKWKAYILQQKELNKHSRQAK